jgi:hypothetical protein
MKAISLLQPWATLVAIGAKHFETRSWSTAFRGPLAIHASMGKQFINMRGNDYICGDEPFCEILTAAATKHATTWRDFKDAVEHPFMPRGAVIATCRLIAVHEIMKQPSLCTNYDDPPGFRDRRYSEEKHREWQEFIKDPPDDFRMYWIPPNEPERSFGDYTPGRFAWILADVKPLATPIPARGSLGLWEWTPPIAISL